MSLDKGFISNSSYHFPCSNWPYPGHLPKPIRQAEIKEDRGCGSTYGVQSCLVTAATASQGSAAEMSPKLVYQDLKGQLNHQCEERCDE